MENAIKNLDIFGQSVQLTFRRESTYKTAFGGLASIAFYAILCYIILLKTIAFSDIENA